jgi:hypothetical protein
MDSRLLYKKNDYLYRVSINVLGVTDSQQPPYELSISKNDDIIQTFYTMIFIAIWAYNSIFIS